MAQRPTDLDPLEEALLDAVDALEFNMGQPALSAELDAELAAEWLEAQVTSRVLDHTARWLRREHGLGYYTIGSAGHESNAVVASALRVTDPALLHYRSGGFYLGRSLRAAALGVADNDPVLDVLRGMLAKSTDQIAGGRHKVFGNHDLSIIPQTSTISSHLPRAVGLALSFAFAPDATPAWPADSIVVCSFGDGSLNHSTAQGAINWASHSFRNSLRTPVMFVCEDNGLGLSVPTPNDWVRASVDGRADLSVRAADGADPVDVWHATSELADDIRTTGRPGLLHLSTVRFLGHAGTDVETAYRSAADIAKDRERDPVLGAARAAVAAGVCGADDVATWILDQRASIRDAVFAMLDEPELLTAEEVMAPIAAPLPTKSPVLEAVGHKTVLYGLQNGLTFAQTVNRTLSLAVESSDDVIIFGEDVGRKGGAYGVTRGLQKAFGADRVFDTLLDEQSIMGLALGAALNGRLPIPEIQYLAYFHNAEDQLRGEAATQAFFSQRQYVNPMVIRIAAYGYQKGFGGHFHNDNSISVLRDIPGIVIASPGHPSDAAGMLAACIDHARHDGAVCVYLEPIARYHDADLHEPGDGRWTAPFDATPVEIGSGRVHGDGTDLTIVTWANGLHLSLRAHQALASEGIAARVLDLRWLAPLPVDQMLEEAGVTGRVLVVDETRRTGGVGEGLVAELVDRGFDGSIGRVAARDSFVPLGAAANYVLVSVDDIVDAARNMVRP